MPLLPLTTQIIWLLLLALPIAAVSWTVTQEEIFREPREFCVRCSKQCRALMARKFFYLFTCEYCLSHYVTILFLFITRYKLLFPDWRGYLISLFALVWVANVYMSLFAFIRVGLKSERTEAKLLESELNEKQDQTDA